MNKILLRVFFLCVVLAYSLTTDAQVVATVGAGTASNTTTSYPAPFGNFWWGARQQQLYTAPELLAAGVPGGAIITAFGFNATALNTNPALTNFELRAANTPVANMAAWVPATTSYYTNASYTPTLGWNTLPLVTPFIWNGVDNVVIETCFNNGSFFNNVSTQLTTTSFTASRLYRQDGAGVCANNGQTSTSNDRTNLRITYTPPTPCVGTPNADTAVASPPNPCPGTNTLICLQNATVASGLSYQWFSSPTNSAPWTLMTNDTLPCASVLAPAVPTYYLAVVTCDSLMLSDTSVSALVTTQTFSPFSNCYCGPGLPISTFSEEGIGQVVMNTIGSSLNNPAVAPPQLNNPGAATTYSNFDTLQPNLILIKGQTVNWDVLQIQLNTFMSDCWVKGFIDYNQNMNWADIGEEVISQASTGANTNNPTGTFTVPTTAISGCTRMRIVLNEFGSAANTGPCTAFTDGETEDYIVCILNPGPYDPGVTAIQAAPSSGCLDSNGTVIVTITNFGSQVLDLSTNPMAIKLNVVGPNGLTSYYDTLSLGSLSPFAGNNTFSINTGINFYEGGCYDINTDTISLIGAVNTNSINDSLFNAIQICNSRPNNGGDYNLCLGDTIPTGQGLNVINCPTGLVQDSVLIPFTITFAGNTPPNPTSNSALGASQFASATLPNLPPGANILNGELSVTNLSLAPLTFTTGPNLTRFSLFKGTTPAPVPNIYHNGLIGNPLLSLPFGSFNYLSFPPAADLNSMYSSGVPDTATINMGHWSTTRPTAPNVLINGGFATTVVTLKLVYEYVPMGVSWYEQPSGGIRISDSSFFDPLTTANTIVNNMSPVGTYTFYGACAADTNCRVESNLIISGLNIDSVSFTNVLCNGDSTGNAYIQGSGGATGLYYTISDGNLIIDTNLTGQFTNLPMGTYTLNVHDSVGCNGGDSLITISEPTLLVIDSIQSTLPTCNPGGDASMTVFASGGTGIMPYDSMTSDNAPTIVNNNVFTNLAGGVTHLVTVYDQNGCTAMDSHSILTPSDPSFTSVTTTDALCFGDTSGTISVTATAGSAGIATYSTVPGPLTQATVGNFSGASAGPYTVTVTDSLNCTADSIVNIAQPTQLGFATVSVDSTNCNGDSTGSITITGTGGKLPYTYTITPNVGNQLSAGVFTDLPAGPYTVQIADSNNNCTHDTILTVLEPAVLTIDTLSVTDVACNGDSTGIIVMQNAGGTGSVLYSTPIPGQQVVPGTITDLTANTYIITGTDANLCTASTSVTITEPTPLVIDSIVSTTPTCVPGCDATMTVYASGGTTTYTYNNGTTTQGSPIFTSQCAGGYTITVTDANGCMVTATYTISTPGAPSWNAVTSTDVLCFGDSNGTIAATTTGGQPVIDFTITPDPNLVGTTTGNFIGLPAGPYTVVATDANSCSIQSVVNIGTPTALSYASIVIDSVNCNGACDGSITVAGGGGITPYDYSITAPAPVGPNTTGIFNALCSDTYTVQITDSNNCTLDTMLTVSQPDTLLISVASSAQVGCNGDSTGSITMSNTGGTGIPAYIISPVNGSTQIPNGTFNNLPADTYTITGTDVNGCTSVTTVTITEPSILVIDSIVSTTPSCLPGCDATMTVYASGGTMSYTYNNGTLTQPGLTFANQCAGNYTVTVTDANSCSVTAAHIISTPGSPVWGMAVVDSVDCNGGTDGSITVAATGGTGPITYSSTPVLLYTGGAFINAPAGNYNLVAEDSIGCSVTMNVDVFEPAIFSVANVVVDSADCFGASTGSVTLTMSGGTPQYNYSINTMPMVNNTTGVFNNLPQGNYTISVTDYNNCSTTTNVTVSEPAALSYTSVITTNVSCNGANDGMINVVGAGGTGTPVYSIAPSTGAQLTAGNFTSLNGNTYTITITDLNNCTLDSVITIIEPVVFGIDTSSATQVLCFGDSSGQIVMTSTGGTITPTPVSYVISPINGSLQAPNGTFSNLPADTYTITATDNNGCTSVQTYTIIEPTSAVDITNIVGVTPSCNPGNDGTLTISAIGGTPPLRYSANASPYQSSNVLSNLPGGLYVVSVQDTNGCVDTMSFNLVNSSAPAWSSVTSSPAICNGDSTGSITGLATGGSGAITYTITPDPNMTGGLTPGNLVAGVFSNLPATLYQITATDGNNCAVVSAISVAQPTAVTFTSVITDSVDCNGGIDGSITVVGNGGTGSLTYGIVSPSTIPPGPTTPPAVFFNLAANSYLVNITDAAACVADSLIVVGEPASLAISSTLTNILCFGDSSGQVVMTSTGGTGNPTYTISPVNGSTQAPNGTFSNLPADTYTITATDANNCVTTATYTLTEPISAVQITNVTGVTPSCTPGGDGSITVTAVGGTPGIQYNLNSGPYQSPAIFNNLNSNTYLVGIIDTNGCTDTMTYILPASGSPTWTSTTANDVLCNGDSTGSIVLVATGGTGAITYSILTPAPLAASNLSGIFSGLPALNYTVEARDANNCLVLANVAVGEPTSLSFASVLADSVNCNGDSDGGITVVGAGGIMPYTYNITPTPSSNATGIFTGLAANTYTIVFTDSNNCTLDSVVTVSEPTQVTIDSISSIDVLCNGDSTGSIYVQSSGGTGNIYHVIGTDTNLNNPSLFANYGAGGYTVSAIDNNGCVVTTGVTVLEPTPLTYSVTSTNALCFGDTTGTITMTGLNGTPGSPLPYIYTLIPATGSQQTAGSFSGLGAGSYLGVVTDANGCTDTTSPPVVITEPTQIVLSTPTVQNIDCFGASTGSIGISATDGTGVKTISLAGNIPPRPSQASPANFQNLPAGTYTLTATDANNCAVSTTITLTQNPQLFFSSITNIEETCFGDGTAEISFQGAGGVGVPYAYVFNNGNPPGTITPSAQTTYTGLAAGTYNIELIDGLGCTYDSNYTLLGPDIISYSEFEITPTTCLDTEDGKITVQAIGGRGGRYTYSLEPGFNVNTNGRFRDLAPRTYTLRTMDTAGCFVDTVIDVPLPSNPMVVNINKEDLGCHGRGNEGRGEAIVTGGTPPYTYLWSSTPVQTTAIADGLYQGLHTVDVVDAQGCLERDTIVIEPGPCCQEVFLPNAFSPNGDGRNDEFRILSTAGMELQQFEVRNRWGQKIWESNNVRSSWDGMYGDEAVNVGTYYYIVRYKCLTDGQDYVKKGDVIVVR